MGPDPQPTFRALADPTRRSILGILATGDMTIAQLCENFEFSRTAIKKHLTILEDGNLIQVSTQGRERINSLKPAGLSPAVDWLSVFDTLWDTRLAAMKSTIEKELN